MTRGSGRTDRSGERPRGRGRASRASFFALALVLLVGAGLRVSYLSEIERSPEFRHPSVDPLFNDYWARALATGDWSSPDIQEAYGRLPGIPERPYFRPPVYPQFLALVYRTVGTGYAAPRVAQMILGIGSALLAFALTRLLMGRAAGVVAAAFMATYWGFIYFEGELQEPSLFIALSLALLLTLVLAARDAGAGQRPAVRVALLAAASGALLGLATLTRANVALFLPVALAWAFWVSRRRRRPSAFRTLAVGLIAGMLVTIAPATARNWVVARDFVPVSSNLGINLYIGNNRSAQGMFVGDAPTLNRFGSCFDYPRIASELEAETGRPLRDSEVSAIYTGKAIAFARENPAAVLGLVASKAYLFWGPHEITLDRVVAYDRQSSRTLRLIPWTFPLALALGLAGAGALTAELRRLAGSAGSCAAPGGGRSPTFADAELTREGTALLGAFALTYCASFLPFFVTAGYRLPVVPVLLIPGAYAAVRFATLVAARDARRAAAWPVAVGALCALASVPFVRYEPGLAKWRFDRGVALALDGRHEEAAAEYREAVAAARGPLPEAHSNLGMALAASGRLDEAESQFRLALDEEPGFGAAHLGLADALVARGKTDESLPHYRAAVEANPASSRARCNLGLALAAAGRFAEAVAVLDEAVAANPLDAGSANNLAWILATAPDGRVRDGRQAVAVAERVRESSSGNDPGVLDTLAAAYAEAGRFDDAVRVAREALALAADRPTLAAEIRTHLESYEALKPLRVPQPAPPAKAP